MAQGGGGGPRTKHDALHHQQGDDEEGPERRGGGGSTRGNWGTRNRLLIDASQGTYTSNASRFPYVL